MLRRRIIIASADKTHCSQAGCVVHLLVRKLFLLLHGRFHLKKAFVLILSLVYLTSSVGATVHLHYCMDKLIGWGWTSQKDKNCHKCGMEKKNAGKCCKDEPKHVKLKLDQKTSQALYKFFDASALTVAKPGTFFQVEATVSSVHALPLSHAPPLLTGNTVYLRNCVFLI